MKRRHEEITTTTTTTTTNTCNTTALSFSTTKRSNTSNHNNNGDVYSRTSITSTKGRGSLSGWVTCPLCNTHNTNSNSKHNNSKSQKKFSLGRGISMHLQQVHTPWKPGKAELARRERIRRRVRGMVHGMFRSKKECSSIVTDKLQQQQQQSGGGEQRNTHGTSCNKSDNHDNDSNEQSQSSEKNHLYFGNAQEVNMKQFPNICTNENEQDYYIRALKHILGKVWDKSAKKKHGAGDSHSDHLTWTPTQEEIQIWDAKVLELSQLVEHQCSNDKNAPLNSYCNVNDGTSGTSGNDVQKLISANAANMDVKNIHMNSNTCNNNNNNNNGSSIYIPAGHDRNGSKIQSYKESLPPFIKAASDGNLDLLKDMIQRCQSYKNNDDKDHQGRTHDNIIQMINVKDRNGSIADHWCAGNGHLDCLKYILELRHLYNNNDLTRKNDSVSHVHENKRRKRDGKTCLHYAARNGHDHIIDYLLDTTPTTTSTSSSSTTTTTTHNHHQRFEVDTISNDSTTPLHLACYGGHASTIKLLITKYHADLLKVNSWKCGIGHWLAMTVQNNPVDVVKCLDLIKDYLVKCQITVKDYIDRAGMVDEMTKSENDSCQKGDSIHSNDDDDNYITTYHIFGTQQGQGHSAVHKACQKRNHIVVKWLMKEAKVNWNIKEIETAGKRDVGGNKPHQIWMSMTGRNGEDDDIIKEMKCFGW